MASRMESTGLPEMIQMSEFSHELLQKHYPEFITTLRGSVEIKVSVKFLKTINVFLGQR
jgi:hypothetical protein